ncbi:hypothetical protein KIN20_016125 [Parelaphostrongylus tenuis]|uniref:Reverse transcriptase domain-containing protein n=1 Tax=Parelaphostrongylus tenuis TaxID=148309 RepID=A0AAD5QQH8_PARTN|nr:hypothetical protein KIN20_016125 [Parelaphostrongylus tenuis]
MGQRLAPNFAIAFMFKVESPVLSRGPLLCCRYIDDCLIICSTQEEMNRHTITAACVNLYQRDICYPSLVD